MKKKHRFKSWLIKVLRKWLNKLEPERNIFKVEHTMVPLLTLNASTTISKQRPLSENHINEILARKLSEELIKYADINQYESIDMNVGDEQIVYRATIRVAVDKRG